MNLNKIANALVVLAAVPALGGLVYMRERDRTRPKTPACPYQGYFANPVHEDSDGVIAPWYPGLNGQLYERASIALNV